MLRRLGTAAMVESLRSVLTYSDHHAAKWPDEAETVSSRHESSNDG